MGKHLIEDVKVGVSAGGMACGPIPGNVVTEVQLRDVEDNSVMFYGITEVEGISNYMISAESLYDIQIKDDTDDEAAWAKVEAAQIVDAECEDEQMNLQWEKNRAAYNEDDPVWKLLAYLVWADWDKVNEIKPKCIGKYIEDIEIPEVEDEDEEYLDDE